MANVKLREDLTVEQIFDAVTSKAGSLRPDIYGKEFDALMSVAGFIMADPHVSDMGAQELRISRDTANTPSC